VRIHFQGCNVCLYEYDVDDNYNNDDSWFWRLYAFHPDWQASRRYMYVLGCANSLSNGSSSYSNIVAQSSLSAELSYFKKAGQEQGSQKCSRKVYKSSSLEGLEVQKTEIDSGIRYERALE